MNETLRKVSLDEIASCFEGIIPSVIATVAPDGTPNVTYLSVVHRVDDDHVALSRQFFKKTDENTTVNPYAQVKVIEPSTGREFWLDLVYERTETAGALFERMSTKLDAVAAVEGMTNIFHLRGVDVCRVMTTSAVPSESPEGPARRDVTFEKLEEFSSRIAGSADLDGLFQTTLSSFGQLLGYSHSFLMLADETHERLYTVASSGYPASGAGSEIRIGDGVIGLAAARHQSVRLTQIARDLTYSQASREFRERGRTPQIEQVIPLPALPSIQSQLVAPMLAHRDLVGVICLQSDSVGAFQASDECVVGILASQVAMAMSMLQVASRAEHEATAVAPAVRPVQVKHYAADDSVFIDNEYLIKGVAGAILWRLLTNYEAEQRVEYSNREIRLDQSLDLPDIKDNLEARLILLRKRLEERSESLRIENHARGRFRLVITRPLSLIEVEGGGPL